ncbi:MAG TPA: alpha/beta hydrolase [Chitinophagaceae bacterium]|nr:alpha/beta hydrolase [Chitinophagaceae bacterium]
MPFIESQDKKEKTRLYYEDWGSGKPLVFIHGWPSSHEMWEYQLLYFAAKGYRVIAYDRRGFGQSFKPWEPYDYSTLADDLKLVLDTLDLQGVTLIGFSMGGGEVARYCSRHNSARVARIVLVSTVLPFLLKTADNPEGIDQKVFDGFIEQLLDDRPAFLAEFGKTFFGETFTKHPVSQSLLDWAHMLTLKGSPKATIDCAGSFTSTDFRKDLASIKLPTLIIHGQEDKTVPIAVSSDRTSKMIPGAIYKVYEGAPHGLFITDKDRLNMDLEAFIRS